MAEKEITLNSPTDKVITTCKAIESAYSFWCGEPGHRRPEYTQSGQTWHKCQYMPVVPVDLITSRNVPMPDFQLQFSDIEDGIVYTFNTLFPEQSGDYEVLVKTDIFAFIYTVKDDFSGWRSHPELLTQEAAYAWYYGDKETRDALRTLRALLLAKWYAVQMCALHPQVKEVFSNPKLSPMRKANPKRKKKQRVCGFMKVHTVGEKEINSLLTGHGKFCRKTLCWYVIGHWRTYKNGRRKFIQGYWKGPLRDARRNLDNGRERRVSA